MLIAALVAGIAQAACPLDEVVVSGTVVDARDGRPLAAATVEAGWNERAAGRMRVTRQTAADGAFTLRILFDTYSGRTLAGRDVCSAQLESLDLAVELSGYSAIRTTLPRAGVTQAQRFELSAAP